MEIPYGFCHCGCGRKTNIIDKTVLGLGLIKGEPRKFIKGHTTKNKFREKSKSWKGGKSISYAGYPRIYMPEHPRANSGYVFEHILKAEKALGKHLVFPHQVHHYTLEQLVICENDSYHKLLHKRQRAYEACGNTSWEKCTFCQQYDQPKNLYRLKTTSYHKKCKAEKDKERFYRYKPTPPLKLGNFWRRIIGIFEKLPENHPVIKRLDIAGMGPDLKLKQEAPHGT